MTRLIAHLDLDSFFVSAERTRAPALLGKAVAVGGTSGRGVISSASYEARRFGVRSAMPVRQALTLCPKLILVKGDYDLYSTLSARVFEILEDYSPLVEATGIDEGYLDLTGTERLLGPAREVALRIQERIREELGLPCSLGLGANRRIAKIATEDAKPNGVFVVPTGQEAAYLAPKPVRVIPGVGAKMDAWFRSRGIHTIRDLQEFPVEVLERHLGSWGLTLARAAQGEGSVDFHRDAKRPGASRERTFSQDLSDWEALQVEVRELCRKLARDLRQANVYGKVLKLKLRYRGFETLTRQQTLERAERDERALAKVALELLETHWERGRPVRLLGVGVSLEKTLEHSEPSVLHSQNQLDLFSSPSANEVSSELEPSESNRREELEILAEKLEARFGKTVLSFGGRGVLKD